MPKLQPCQRGCFRPLVLFIQPFSEVHDQKWACRSSLGGAEGVDVQLGGTEALMLAGESSDISPSSCPAGIKAVHHLQRPPCHSSRQTLVGVFRHYGQQHCDVIRLSTWTEKSILLLGWRLAKMCFSNILIEKKLNVP